MKSIAHIVYSDNEWKIQSLEEHSKNTAELAKSYAEKFGCGDWGYVLGLYHDQGKQSTGFQNYIKYSSGYDNASVANEKVRHSNIGGILAMEHYENTIGKILHSIISSHHSGLCDLTENNNRISDKEAKAIISSGEISFNKNIIPLSIPKNIQTSFDLSHWMRMLFSCLCDADYLDTERFMNPSLFKERSKEKMSIIDLKKKFDEFMNKLQKDADKSSINQLRQDISGFCELCGKENKDNFAKLIVPTGAGKTLSSLNYALNKAIILGKERIIITTPYTSITTQTAKICKDIFGNENVLEIHSNYDSSLDETAEFKKNIDLTSQNFDAPIVVTTDVQLLESMQSNKSSRCRKLHNLVNSVVIIDETQKLPINLLQSTVDTIDTYARLFGTVFLFMSATELPLDKEYKDENIEIFRPLSNVTSIIPSSVDVFTPFRRVNFKTNETYIVSNLATIISECKNSIMCIANTKNYVRKLFNQINGKEKKCYHLSKYMCNLHINDTLNEVKRRLSSNDTIKLITTSLVEAGVDIDFPEVYKMEDGQDSIVQAAGRCNRNGKLKRGMVHIFKLQDENGNNLKSAFDGDMIKRMNVFNEIARHHMNDKDYDFASQESINEFYDKYFNRCEPDKFDKAIINEGSETIKIIEESKRLNFKKVAEGFKIVEDKNNINVIVPYKDGANIISKIKHIENGVIDFHSISKYFVQINEKQKKKLDEYGYIEPVFGSESLYILKEPRMYDNNVGLLMPEEAVFIL